MINFTLPTTLICNSSIDGLLSSRSSFSRAFRGERKRHKMSAGGVLQLVDARGELRIDELESYVNDQLAAGRLSSPEDTLVTIAVIGARGSGKSTLANRLFGTDFDVGRPFAGRGTKGCVAAVAPSSALILDTQGADGRDGDTEKVARVATFALALADALVFNLWTADIGRYEAAGYALLRTVFLEFTRMYAENDPPKTLLLFVIRDHDDGSTLESLSEVIMEDVRDIWSQIDGRGSVPVTELFQFEFASLPHIRHRADEFDAAVKDLGERFSDPKHPKYLLRPEYSISQPVEGLIPYAEIVWKETAQDKAVELPAKKDLIAAYRCDVAYDAQQRPAIGQLSKWTSEVDRGRTVTAFGDKATALLDTALERYDRDTASHASASIRTKKRSELRDSLQSRVRSLFNKQLLLLQNAALQKFKDILLAHVANPVSDAEMQHALRRVDEWFARKAETLLVPSMRLSFRGQRQEVQKRPADFWRRIPQLPHGAVAGHATNGAAGAAGTGEAAEYRVRTRHQCGMRPAGFGNFQLITGYSRGPHTMQFTLVNDKDAAEQEGQGQVPLFRIQPTITTTIDL